MTAPLNLLDLFSGVGGFSLGLERTGRFRTVAFCEAAEFPRRVLAARFPGVPIYDDVRTLTADRLRADGISVDAICGGFPCQDISAAKQGAAGIEGAQSGLWSEYARLIGELRPRRVFVENSAFILGRGLGRVLGDLAGLGLDAEWHRLRASDFGAPHERPRVGIVAYPHGDAPLGPSIPRPQRLSWPNEPGISGSNDGFSARMERAGVPPILHGVNNQPERRHALGNAIVPAFAEHLGRYAP